MGFHLYKQISNYSKITFCYMLHESSLLKRISLWKIRTIQENTGRMFAVSIGLVFGFLIMK